jgi:hypothetical protein
MAGYDYTKAGRGRPLPKKRSHHTSGQKNPALGLRNSERGGSDNPNSKLSDAQVVMLREYRRGGWSHADLALLFGISESRSSEICRGKGYKNAGGPIAGTREKWYCSSVTAQREKLNPDMAKMIRALHEDGLNHGQIAQRIYDDMGVEISKSLVGLLLRGHTKY